jgi:hypothetical protein
MIFCGKNEKKKKKSIEKQFSFFTRKKMKEKYWKEI